MSKECKEWEDLKYSISLVLRGKSVRDFDEKMLLMETKIKSLIKYDEDYIVYDGTIKSFLKIKKLFEKIGKVEYHLQKDDKFIRIWKIGEDHPAIINIGDSVKEGKYVEDDFSIRRK